MHCGMEGQAADHRPWRLATCPASLLAPSGSGATVTPSEVGIGTRASIIAVRNLQPRQNAARDTDDKPREWIQGRQSGEQQEETCSACPDDRITQPRSLGSAS